MTGPVYQLLGVQVRYGRRVALSVDHLEVQPGEILAVIGPSGAGKSTLLRLLQLIELPAAGQVYYRGRLRAGAVPLDVRRTVTTVFQRPVLLDRSVADNIGYGLSLRGERAVQSKVARALERVGLAPLARQSARRLSGGEAQRAALARALVLEPEVLLLDEPTANLDPYHVEVIERLIQEQNAERRTTTVLVTHNIFQARRLAHRTALLISGRLIEIGATGELFERPTQPQTAAFLRGEMVY